MQSAGAFRERHEPKLPGQFKRTRQGRPCLGAVGIVTLAEFTPKLRPLRFMALKHFQ